VEFPTQAWNLAAVTGTVALFVYYEDGLSTVERVFRGETGRTETLEVDGWISTIAPNRDGEVIIATWDHIILPAGVSVPIDGLVNIAW